MSTTTTKTTAMQMFKDLRHNLMAAEAGLEQIITAQAWTTLGYSTFSSAWEEHMVGVRPTGLTQARILMAMFHDGSTIEQVAKAVNGVGQRTAQLFFHAYLQEMGPEKAMEYVNRTKYETYDGEGEFVRGHFRRPKQRRGSLTMQGFTEEELKSWKAAASEANMSLAEWAQDVLRKALG